MNKTRTDERDEMGEYDPDRYVSDLWTEELTAAGISRHRADQIRQLTFGDPELSLGDPSSEDVLRVVLKAVEQFDFESAINEDADVSADELRDRLVEATYAGLTGRLLGPAAGPSDVALDNDGVSTVDLKAIDWIPPGEEVNSQRGSREHFQNPDPEEDMPGKQHALRGEGGAEPPEKYKEDIEILTEAVESGELTIEEIENEYMTIIRWVKRRTQDEE